MVARRRGQPPGPSPAKRFRERYRAACELLTAELVGVPDPALRATVAQRLLRQATVAEFVRAAGWPDAVAPLTRLLGDSAGGSLQLIAFEAALALTPWAPLLSPAAPAETLTNAEIPRATIRALLDPVVLFGGCHLAISELDPAPDALTPEVLGGMHEALTAARGRSGSYYTPPSVVAFMVRAALTAYLQAALTDESPAAIASLVDRRDATALGAPDHAASALRNLRAGDPACGGGAFLVGLLHELLALEAALAAPLPPGESPGERRLRLVEQNLYGVDLDPVAAEITRLRLWLATAGSSPGTAAPPVPALNVVVGDSLLCPPPGAPSAEVGFTWERAFPAVFGSLAGERCGFDCLLANPPYLSTKRGFGRGCEEALRSRYATARGQYDAAGLFIERGLELLQPEGAFAFIVPRTLLTNTALRPVRRLLETRELTVLAEPGAVFEAAVETVIVAGNRRPGSDRQVTLARGPRLAGAATRQAPLSELLTPAGTWVPRPAPLALGNFAALRQLPVLGDLFSITRGEECGKRDRSVRDAPGEQRYPLLRGEDVTAYATRHAGLWLDRSELGTRAKSPALYAAPKLLVRRVANNLVAAIERDGCHVLNTLYVLRPRTAVMPSLEYACALLNAPALNACFRAMWLNDDQLFPYLRIEQLRALPFALPAEATARQAVEVVGQLEASLAAGEQAAAAALQEQLAALVVESYRRAMELARATTL